MPKFIQYLIFILAAILPMQNALINFVVNRLNLPEWLSLWKEGLVAILMIFFLWQIWRKVHEKKYKFELRNKWPLATVTLLTIISILSSFWLNEIEVSEFIVGFRFELWWLWFFAVTFTWWRTIGKYLDLSKFFKQFKIAIYIGFVLAAIIALVGLALGQPTVSNLWNADATTTTESLLTPAPDCHVVDYQVSGCRLAGPFSTPNHFVGYLLLILPIFLTSFLDWWKQTNRKWYLNPIADLTSILLILLFVALSFSRFAWLGLTMFAGFLLILAAIHWLPKKPWVNLAAKIDFFTVLLIPLFIATVAVNLSTETIRELALPEALVKPSSTTLHARHTNSAIQIITNHPKKLLTGWGLPSAGSAAKEQFVSQEDNEMIQANRTVAFQNGLRPADLAIPENWFLQLILNGGLAYFLLYTAIILIPIWSLLQDILKFDVNKPPYKNLLFGLAFFSVILGNLLLHIWENQTVALYWTMAWLYWRF